MMTVLLVWAWGSFLALALFGLTADDDAAEPAPSTAWDGEAPAAQGPGAQPRQRLR